MKSVTDAGEGRTLFLARDELVREHADIGSVQFMSQSDEAASLVHMLGSFGRIGFVHLGRSTKIGNGETRGREIPQRTFQAGTGELGAFRQIHLILDAA